MAGEGDRLARGATSAIFMPPKVVKIDTRNTVKVKTKKTVWGECRDCDGKFYSAAEFSEHIHATDPVTGKLLCPSPTNRPRR